jgi:hypothetical protein
VFRSCWRAWQRAVLPTVASALLFALAAFFVRAQTDTFLNNLVTTDRNRVLIWIMMGAAVSIGRLAATPPPRVWYNTVQEMNNSDRRGATRAYQPSR